MADAYYVDLSTIPLEEFWQRLRAGDLLPGRVILLEQREERYQLLRSQGIDNLQDLHEALKTKTRLQNFADRSGLPLDYLTILRRELNSYTPNPVNLDTFPGVSKEHTQALAALGIKHSKQLLTRAAAPNERAQLAEQSGVPAEALDELVQLCDLVRINGVGPVFARLLYDVGVKSVAAVAASSAEELYTTTTARNAEMQLSKVMATQKDMDYCIRFARLLPPLLSEG